MVSIWGGGGGVMDSAEPVAAAGVERGGGVIGTATCFFPQADTNPDSKTIANKMFREGFIANPVS